MSATTSLPVLLEPAALPPSWLWTPLRRALDLRVIETGVEPHLWDRPAVAGVCPMTGTSDCPTDMDQTEGCTRC